MLKKRHIAWTGLTALALAGAAAPLVAGPKDQKAKTTTSAKAEAAKDTLILRNGKVIEGKILSETDTEVEMLVMLHGISAPATYSKTDILEIQHAADATDPVDTFETITTNDASITKIDVTLGDDVPTVYLIELEGDLGWDISKTPLQNSFDDALNYDPDVIIVKLDCKTARPGFDGLWTTEALAPIIEEVIFHQDKRVVFWIELAQGGAAFLPFISPEMYFTNDGHLGGIGDLDGFDIGDDWVNEKQISLRLGHAEGFAIKGGYDPVLIRSMARKHLWLYAKIVNGSPVYVERELRPSDGDGWLLLSDDGEGDNEDEWTFEGNDVLNIDQELATYLQISKGYTDELDELVFKLDLGRDYKLIDGRAEKIFDQWSENVERARDEFIRLRSDLQDLGRSRDANELGTQRRILKQMRSILTRFAEVLDPSGQQTSRIDIQIEENRQAFQTAREREKNRRSRRR